MLSVIIPTLDESKYLPALLDSLVRESATLSEQLEVIVVDASKDDCTFDAARRYITTLDLQIVRSEVADVGTQRNMGARRARGSLFLFLDADVILGPRSLVNSITRIDRDTYGVVSIRHKSDKDDLLTYVGLGIIYGLIFLARAMHQPVTNGDFILTNRVTFKALSGFREGFLLGEDTDFGYRAKQLGAQFPLVWSSFIITSDRRLATTSIPSLIWKWSRTYVDVLRGRGPTGSRAEADRKYPFGIWN